VVNTYDARKTNASMLAVATGAAAGALAIYVLGTPGGRRLLNSAIGLLDDFSFECARFSQACTRAQIAASGSWQAVQGSTINTTGGERETAF